MTSRLAKYIEHIENMLKEREEIKEEVREGQARVREINKEIKSVLQVAEGVGYKPRVLKVILERRAEDPYEVEENDMLLERYEQELRIGHNSGGARLDDGCDI